MKYASIDIETTGLIPDWCQILEVGAVVDDLGAPPSELPHFHTFVVHDRIIGQPYALAMNAAILRLIAEYDRHPEFNFMLPHQVAPAFNSWLVSCGLDMTQPVVCAGKNFGSFDRQFLERLPDWHEWMRFAHRSLDPGSLYFRPTDARIPSTEVCAERAGIKIENQHRAVDDALLVIKLIRARFQEDITIVEDADAV